ncbi:MAG: hypothetical protein COA43_15505 [Robiginitomaculum sp.]|nr:MAG: hypothetical protein COA43_15505 [Robiginitomaculum sp.]
MLLRFIISTWLVFIMCGAGFAFAADPYTVKGVHVDATAENALEAQTLAISQGQAAAANILIERMSLASQRRAKGFRGVSAKDGAKMIRALEIANEKRSGNRYLGDITVAFNPNAISQYMRVNGLTLVATQSRKRLVIPTLDGALMWSGHEMERAWQKADFDNALTPMFAISPKAGLSYLIEDEYGQNISLENLRKIGRLFGVEQVLLAHTRATANGYRVSLKDVSLDRGTMRNLGTVSGVSARSAVLASVSALEEDWKDNVVSTVSAASVVIPVSVLYRSQKEWLHLQDVINGSAQIRSARLEAVSKRGAVMTLTYGGDLEKLRNELAYKGVRLEQDEELGLVLSKTGAF